MDAPEVWVCLLAFAPTWGCHLGRVTWLLEFLIWLKQRLASRDHLISVSCCHGHWWWWWYELCPWLKRVYHAYDNHKNIVALHLQEEIVPLWTQQPVISFTCVPFKPITCLPCSQITVILSYIYHLSALKNLNNLSVHPYLLRLLFSFASYGVFHVVFYDLLLVLSS